MYGNSCTINITKLANGYTVRMTDPEIVKKNKKRDADKKYSEPWVDPEVTMAFEDAEDVIEFLSSNLEKIMPDGDGYETSFVKALKEEAD